MAEKSSFVNASPTGEIPSFNGDEKAKAMDFSNYFCSYAQLYHQKQMLTDHIRMAAYHGAIMSNAHLFKDKVVMDIGTGSGILAVWAAQAGAKRVYAIEYTDMAKHAKKVMEENRVEDVVTIIQSAVEEVVLPEEVAWGQKKGDTQCVDIIISEWMGYFLLRESMLDSVIRARDKFLKPKVGLMFPSHASMMVSPIFDEDDRIESQREYAQTMNEWDSFVETTSSMYNVNMNILGGSFEKEQKDYYLLSSRWAELNPDAVLCDYQVVKELDLAVCSVDDARGILASETLSHFDFDVVESNYTGLHNTADSQLCISGLAGWFTTDFKSRTDVEGAEVAPKVTNPVLLSTGPEAGYTHWGQQTFHFLSKIPLIRGQVTRLRGHLEMTRSKDNSRLYNCRISYNASRRLASESRDGNYLMEAKEDTVNVYQIP